MIQPRRARALMQRVAVLFSLTVLGGAATHKVQMSDAHELSQASATLILRDAGFVELRLQVPWADVLHTQLMPRVTTQEFLVTISNQRPAQFARDLAKVETFLERGTRLVVDGRTRTGLSHWQWPSAIEVQQSLRRELMSRLADGSQFEHASRLPAVAERTLGSNAGTVRLQLPTALGPTLLTVYRPAEQWLNAGEVSDAIAVANSRAR